MPAIEHSFHRFTSTAPSEAAQRFRVSDPKLSGFAEVGHHMLPTFPLETVCAGKCSAPLAQQALGAPPVLGSFNVRRKRGGVVCHALDRGMVGSLGLGFETYPEPVGFEYGR